MADPLDKPDIPEGGPPSPESVAAGHEVSDIDVRAVLYFAAGMAAFAVVMHVGLAALFFLYRGDEAREKSSSSPFPGVAAPDTPANTAPPLEGLERRNAATRVRGVSYPDDAERYSWAEGDEDRVNIPVDEAMKRMLKDPPQSVPDRKWQDAGPRPPSDANSGRRPEENR